VIHYKKGIAFLEKVSLQDLAQQFGTPLFVYSQSLLQDRCKEIKEAFASHPTKVCYALKANSNIALLKFIFSMGIGADVVSGGELEKALLAGALPEQIVFSGVGKTVSEIELALKKHIFSFNVESVEEIQLIGTIAKQMSQSVSISLRINPNINVKTNPYIATGLYRTKFGFPESQIAEALQSLRECPELKLKGLSCHLGSQIHQLLPYTQATRRLRKLADELRAQGHAIETLDVGGGFGVDYHGKPSHSLDAYAKAIQKEVKDTDYGLLIEPGRSLVAEAGILVSTVLFTKHNPYKHFVIVDASMTELIRPALYEAFHPIEPCLKRKGKLCKVDIVGPVCETSDFLGTSRLLPPLQRGDLVWIGFCGAYGSSMSSNYNVRPRAAEVLVSSKEVKQVCKREALADLWKRET